MGRLNWKWIGLGIAGATPMVARAQLTLTPSSPTPVIASPEIGGVGAVDMIALRSMGPGAPLRHGNVVVGSEVVQLDNQLLRRNDDYMMDYASGVVYVKVAQKSGQTLLVSYRYKDKADPTAATPFTGIGTFKFSIAPESFNLLLGLGETERQTDGSVLTDNVFGLNNTFKLSKGSTVGGLAVFSNKQKQTSASGLNLEAPSATAPGTPAAAAPGSGTSQLIVQQLQTKFLGGTGTVDYQDVSKDFTAFGAAKNAGYDDAAVARLQSEKGLQRMGYSLQNVKFGGLGISTSFRDLKSDTGAIYWRTFGLNQGPLKVNWSSQKVDQTFNRFADISEADRVELTKEAGITRNSLSAAFDQKVSKLSFNSSSILDATNNSEIKHEEFALDTSKIKFQLGDDTIGGGFNRFANLMDPEKAAYGLEAGLRRKWMNLQATMFGAGAPISFSQKVLSSGAGAFKSQDSGMAAKTWSVTRSVRNSDPGFQSLGAMADTELNANITAISKMYAPTQANAPQINPAAEKGAFLAGVGLSRDYTALNAQPFKNWNFQLSHLALKGQHDSGSVDSVNLANKHSNFTYRKQGLGSNFSELSNMMSFEKQQLGSVAGLDRTDLGFNTQWAGRKLSLSQLNASIAGQPGGLTRSSLSYQDKKLNLQANSREIGPSFTMANQLVDAEKDLLASLQGYSESDAKLNYAPSANFKINATYSNQLDQVTHEASRSHNLVLNWAPDKTTKISYTSAARHDGDPANVLFANDINQMELSKNLGRYGQVDFLDESIRFGGLDRQPDEHKEYVSYETKLNSKTSFRTEQTRTAYDNGTKEDISTNTISTEVTKKLGVSVSNVQVDRGHSDMDEEHRNYGFWYDFGNGLRISYGYARQLTGDSGGTYNSSFAIGQDAGVLQPNQTNTLKPGTVGSFSLAGGYGVNTWDQDPNRVQSFSNVALTTAKPFKFLMLKNVKLNIGMDSSADYGTWLRENRLASFSANVGSNTIGYDYRSQVDQSGQRGIDRSIRFQTSQSPNTKYAATVLYKLRTLPTDQQILIRDFNVSAKPTKNMTVSNLLQTNPEVANTGAFLGSTVQASRSNKWAVDLISNRNFTYGAQWQELIDQANNREARTAGVNMKLFASTGSPITLYYGLDQGSLPGQKHDNQRYSLQFDEKPGLNQMLSIFVGNVSYVSTLANGTLTNGFTLRLDYQFRF